MAGIIAKKILEEIRFRNDIVDVVGSYLSLAKKGSTFKALCPFHKEKTPSFVVNAQRQIFHCFGCGVGGDVFKFVMMHEGVDFGNAAAILAQRSGIRLEFEEGGADKDDKSALYSMMEQLAAFYHRVLTDSAAGKTGRDYLEKRNLLGDVADAFRLGFAPDMWDSTLKWAAKHKFNGTQLETAGMVVKSPKSDSGYYDRFRNRLMFPIRDLQGRIIGFSGRVLESDAKSAKYVNSPETPLFRKSHVLYGLYEARKHIVDSREAVICEGQIDVIRCHQAGFTSAIAAQGTAFTEDHARLARRYADSVVICFDSDNAGQAAAIRAAQVFMSGGLVVRIAALPAGEDPDSFITSKGGESFRSVLDKAVSLVEFQINVLSSRHDPKTESGLMRISKAVLQTIGQAPSAIQRSKLVEQASELLNIPPNAMESDLRYALRFSARRHTSKDSSETADAGSDQEDSPQGSSPVQRQRPREEMELTEHVVACPQLGELVARYLPSTMFTDSHCLAVIESAVQAMHENSDLMSIVAERDDGDRTLTSFAAQAQMAPSKIVGKDTSREAAVRELILYIRRRDLKKEKDRLLRELQDPKVKAGDNTRIRLAELGHDLKLLKDWESAVALLDLDA